MSGKALVLRTCAADMSPQNEEAKKTGFRWPRSGPVECPDWDATPKCGYGSTAASSGNGSTAASSGNGSTAASSGNGSISMVAGFSGRVKAGKDGAFALCWKDGERPRIVACHVGEGGIRPDTWYGLNERGEVCEYDDAGNYVASAVATVVAAQVAASAKKKTRAKRKAKP